MLGHLELGQSSKPRTAYMLIALGSLAITIVLGGQRGTLETSLSLTVQ
jgi:hypothetical protein